MNDNYGASRSSRQELVDAALSGRHGHLAEQCILYSALDAYIRHFAVAVPRDAVAHIHAHLAGAALELMELNMDADVGDAADCRL